MRISQSDCAVTVAGAIPLPNCAGAAKISLDGRVRKIVYLPVDAVLVI